MNFPIRDSLGEVNEAERVKHLSESVTVDDFIQHLALICLKNVLFTACRLKTKMFDV